MKNTVAVCLAAGGAKPPKSDTASVGNHRSDDVARFLRLPLIDSPLSSMWMALLIKLHNGICDGVITDVLIPVVQRQLRDDDDGLAFVPVLQHLQKSNA